MNPYTDPRTRRNRGYAVLLASLFPEQTKTIPRIIVWSIIFLLDLILGIGGAAYFCILPAGKLVTAGVIAAIVGVFWLQGVIWYAIVKLFQKRKELD